MDSNQRISRQVGGALRRLRVQRGQAQRQVADAADIPLAALAAYERGERLPDLRTLRLVLSAFSVGADEFGRHLGPWGTSLPFHGTRQGHLLHGPRQSGAGTPMGARSSLLAMQVRVGLAGRAGGGAGEAVGPPHARLGARKRLIAPCCLALLVLGSFPSAGIVYRCGRSPFCHNSLMSLAISRVGFRPIITWMTFAASRFETGVSRSTVALACESIFLRFRISTNASAARFEISPGRSQWSMLYSTVTPSSEESSIGAFNCTFHGRALTNHAANLRHSASRTTSTMAVIPGNFASAALRLDCSPGSRGERNCSSARRSLFSASSFSLASIFALRSCSVLLDRSAASLSRAAASSSSIAASSSRSEARSLASSASLRASAAFPLSRDSTLWVVVRSFVSTPDDLIATTSSPTTPTVINKPPTRVRSFLRSNDLVLKSSTNSCRYSITKPTTTVAVETQSQNVNESSRESSALAALSNADRSMERYDRARLICVCIIALLLGGASGAPNRKCPGGHSP